MGVGWQDGYDIILIFLRPRSEHAGTTEQIDTYMLGRCAIMFLVGSQAYVYNWRKTMLREGDTGV